MLRSEERQRDTLSGTRQPWCCCCGNATSTLSSSNAGSLTRLQRSIKKFCTKRDACCVVLSERTLLESAYLLPALQSSRAGEVHTPSRPAAADLLLHQISQRNLACLLLWHIPATRLAKSLMQCNPQILCLLLILAFAQPPGCCCCRLQAPEPEHRPVLTAHSQGCPPERSEWWVRSSSVWWACSSSVWWACSSSVCPTSRCSQLSLQLAWLMQRM